MIIRIMIKVYCLLTFFSLGFISPALSQPEPQGKSEDLNGGWKSSVKKGWCVYTFQCIDTLNLRAIQRSKPEMIRWFVEWDRMDIRKNGQSLRKFYIDRCRPFFRVCADQQITLVVQMWVKDRFWLGDGNGGVQWAKPAKTANYPSDIDASYGSFVRELVKAMNDEGIKDENIIMEAWNEPDLLWGVPGSPPNYHEPWKFLSKKGFSKWMGGSGEKWDALHQVLNQTNPNIRWANGSVGIHERYRSWIVPCYRINKISILDFHYYLWSCKTPEQYCDSISRIIDRWDEELFPPGREPLPFFIGECARLSSGKPEDVIISAQDADMMRKICQMLYEKYGRRFMGMTAHGPIRMWKEAAWYEEQYSGQ